MTTKLNERRPEMFEIFEHYKVYKLLNVIKQNPQYQAIVLSIAFSFLGSLSNNYNFFWSFLNEILL